MDASVSSSMASSRGGDVPSTVQVALRIRPQGNREKLEGSRVCTSVIPGEPQVTIGTDRSFTYDHVFDQATQQVEIYDSCIEKLVNGLFDGFNATVLAYGQTGSGKTYTMGTAFDTGAISEHEVGVIPRALAHVFRRVSDLKQEAREGGILEPTFEVSVQFIELYNEEIIDLLANDRSSSFNIRIHEDARGEIYLHGVTTRQVQDLHSTLEILKNGALNRTVAATNMNEQSSRSHAIFSLHIKQQRVVPQESEPVISQEIEMELLSAKFHFVDLAGSERLKRTGATGDRAKEGISINCGLLALGNVISALGGANGKVSHVPYRDSKLTRLLQDSLGGNSRTLMVACVSPSDSDFVETLNTLKYANRAKNIKNKVVANQDKSSKLIGELRGRIAALEAELLEFKQGRRTVGSDGVESVNDQYHENVMLTAEINQLRFRVKALQETNEILRNRNVDLMAKDLGPNGCSVSSPTDEHGGSSDEANSSASNDAVMDPVQATVRKYLEELERMRSQLYESQAVANQLRKEMNKWKNQALGCGGFMESNDNSFTSFSHQQLIEDARADIERLRRTVSTASNEVTSDYASHADTAEEDGTSNDADELDEEDEYDQDVDEDTVFDEDQKGAALRDNLADLQTEINIKERLIAELERSDRHLAEVRLSYEKKLTELSAQIKKMEAERDRVVMEAEAKKSDKASQEQAKRIREEYERKLADMRNEFRKLQMVEREHKRMQARQERERQELMRYQAELKELKRVKVDLMKKIKEEMKKAQQQQSSASKKLAALDKEARRRDNIIRQLENKDRQREQFMKRTTEEINRLRKAQKEQAKQTRLAATPKMTPMRSTPYRPARTPGVRGQPPPEATYSPKQAKMKWTFIEKKISRLVTQKQTVGKMEEELGRLLEERTRLNEEIKNLEHRFISLADVSEREAVADQIDGCQQKIRYVMDQITETQTAITDMDGGKDGDMENNDESTELSNIEGLIEHCSNLIEAKYLMQHLFNACLEHAVAAAKADSHNKESEARIQQLEQQSFINEQLLSTVIADKNLKIQQDMRNGSFFTRVYRKVLSIFPRQNIV
uniref:Kinesin motor domain-containing protein n=1 Tax=Haemonchus contortus TaxID=6289 RepID=A0A7I4YIE6_HAECO